MELNIGIKNDRIGILTKRFILRELTEDDVTERYLHWMVDPAAVKFISASAYTKNLYDLQLYIRQRIGRDDILFLGIFERNTGLHIGNIKYEPVNSESGYAIMGILIGDTSYRGKGVTPEVVKASAHWLKENRKIKQILLGVSTENLAGIRAYEKVGFIIEKTPYLSNLPADALSMVWRL